MNKNLVSLDECKVIVAKRCGTDSDKLNIVDYDVNKYSDGYPGFLGDYFALKIRFCEVNELVKYTKVRKLFNHELNWIK